MNNLPIEDELLPLLPLPAPDPAWDYAILWAYLGSAKQELDSVIRCLNQAETADPELDKKVKVKLQWTNAYVKSAIALLSPVDESN